MPPPPSAKVTISQFKAKKKTKKIVTVTAYDYPTALLADRAGVDLILVGDSGAVVALGYPDTRPITMDEMLMMARAVARGVKRALLVADMPFMSYNVSTKEAIKNAGRMIKEGGMDTVKIEGGREIASTLRALTTAGIPVMAHIGFTPQTTATQEGYRVQGKTAKAAARLLEDAILLEEAGAFSIVLEMVTSENAEAITETVSIPTIGIGAGVKCDGQVLVLHDLLGLFEAFTPKFAKRYRNLAGEVQGALENYRDDVISGRFPGEEHTFHMDPSEREKFQIRRKILAGAPPLEDFQA